jgi:hypothetical protein
LGTTRSRTAQSAIRSLASVTETAQPSVAMHSQGTKEQEVSCLSTCLTMSEGRSVPDHRWRTWRSHFSSDNGVAGYDCLALVRKRYSTCSRSARCRDRGLGDLVLEAHPGMGSCVGLCAMGSPGAVSSIDVAADTSGRTFGPVPVDSGNWSMGEL